MTLVLQGISPELISQANPPSFLVKVEDKPGPLFFNPPHGLVELVAAVTALGAEDVPGQALGVDPQHYRLIFGNFAFLNHQVAIAVILDFKITVVSWQVYEF